MKLYSENKDYKLYQGNMLDMLEEIEPNVIDSIVTDPPYELNFMGKGWDNAGVSFDKDTWKKCFEVLKPGGYLLAFGGSRTYHRIACAIEDAGFEIRDTIMWLYGSGFPKSMALGKTIDKKEGNERIKTGKVIHHAQNRSGNLRKNTHPTVKPTELMQYLVRLVTPNGGVVLDPFNGSGSTGKAVIYENKERNKNYKYIGIELTEEYLPIAKARIEYVSNSK